jgi:hypothetical protein
MPAQRVRKSPILREGKHWLVDAATGCWEWRGRKHKGYGRVDTGPAHREVWRQAGRPLDPREHLHHRCENRGCVNPDHMEPSMPVEHLTAHKRRDSKLSESQVAEIRASTMSSAALAEQYGVGRSAIKHIRDGSNWRGIGPDRPGVRCRYCDQPITTGNRHKVYCCREHRVLWNTRKRKVGE